jgi:hypothetical protein
MAKKATPFTRIKSTKPAKHPHYWKLRTAFLESQQAEHDARAVLTAGRVKFVQAMTAAGLDPKLKYSLDDATESITLTE